MPANRILQSLPEVEISRLRPCLRSVKLPQGHILETIHEPIRHVYFVESGMVSLVALSQGGTGVETGVVGAEGMVGSLIAIDLEISPIEAVVQISGHGLTCAADAFLDAYHSLPTLRTLVNSNIGHVLVQAQQNALCHALHSVESRLSRWMLQARDIVGGSVLDLTQEFLSNMLGVRRTSVSMTAHALQRSGFIRYRRGKIEILDRQGLKESACECYRAVSQRLSEAGRIISPHVASRAK